MLKCQALFSLHSSNYSLLTNETRVKPMIILLNGWINTLTQEHWLYFIIKFQIAFGTRCFYLTLTAFSISDLYFLNLPLFGLFRPASKISSIDSDIWRFTGVKEKEKAITKCWYKQIL